MRPARRVGAGRRSLPARLEELHPRPRPARLGHDPDEPRRWPCSGCGERETDTAHLEQAVAAYRLALEERTRDRVPLQWAMTGATWVLRSGASVSAGAARQTSSSRLPRPGSRSEEFTRDRVPLDWARTQMNLGAAGSGPLASAKPAAAHLEQAVAALRLALEERTRDRVPLGLGDDREQLGLWGFETLGERESGTANLEQSVAAPGSRSRSSPATASRSTGPGPRPIWATRSRALGERESGAVPHRTGDCRFPARPAKSVPATASRCVGRGAEKGLGVALARLGERTARGRGDCVKLCTACERQRPSIATRA